MKPELSKFLILLCISTFMFTKSEIAIADLPGLQTVSITIDIVEFAALEIVGTGQLSFTVTSAMVQSGLNGFDSAASADVDVTVLSNYDVVVSVPTHFDITNPASPTGITVRLVINELLVGGGSTSTFVSGTPPYFNITFLYSPSLTFQQYNIDFSVTSFWTGLISGTYSGSIPLTVMGP